MNHNIFRRYFSNEARRSRRFVDKCRVVLRAGNGGKGCIAHTFLSNKRPKTSDGGNGGIGGSVILRAVPTSGKLDSLNLDSYHVNATHGTNGSGNAKAGKNGKTVYLDVPIGTVAREILKEDRWSEEDWLTYEAMDLDAPPLIVYGRSIDFSEPGQTEIAAVGGRGGLGNISRDPRKVEYGRWLQEQKDELAAIEAEAKAEAKEIKINKIKEQKEKELEAMQATGEMNDMQESDFKELEDEAEKEEEEEWTVEDQEQQEIDFAWSEMEEHMEEEEDFEQDQITDVHHIAGTFGEEGSWELELKTIAEVGLVGYPNAGKSTLLSCLSRAKPKVAAYPFTTLHPYVGVTEFRDGFRYSVADIPGLVDGASENHGLGHSFLRHIERTNILCYVRVKIEKLKKVEECNINNSVDNYR